MCEVNTEIVKDKTKEWPQILAILLAAISSFNAACLFNWTSPSIPILISNEYPNIDLESASYLTVVPPIATILSCPIYSLCVDKFGRKYSLLTIAVLHLTSWILISQAKSIYVFYLSRVLFGIADAAMFVVLPVYIAEVTTPKVRGTWGNAMAFCIYFGQFTVNVVGYYCTIRITAFIFGSMSIIFFFSFIFMPETPYYYIMRKKYECATNSLKMLRRIENVDSELNQLKTDVQRQLSESGTYKDIFLITSNRNALFVAALGRGIQQISGISAFAVYTQYIFQEAGQNIDKGHSSMIYTGMLAISNLFATTYVDKLGRKLSMTISCFGSGLILVAQATYFYLKQANVVDLSSITWFPIVGMIAFVLTFSIGLGLVPILLLGEVFSTSIKGKASGVMTVIFSIYITVITKLFQYLVSNFGLYVPFTLFAIGTLMSTFLSYYFIPETKGKTLEEIQQILKGNKK